MIQVELNNLGKINTNEIIIKTDKNTLLLFFSYSTIVGFSENGRRTISKNIWSKTTGKLLNDLMPDHKERTEHNEFLTLLNDALVRLS